MASDLRQVLGAFLTFSMFIMLGNMIKRDHIDPLWEPSTIYTRGPHLPETERTGSGPWKDERQVPKPCWKKSSNDGEMNDQSNGYIFFSLTHGPEFHASQIANAVAVAKHFGATLAIPDIRETDESGEKMKFEEIYDVSNFIETLKGVVKVDKNPPADILSKKPAIVRVPNRVSIQVVASKITPIFSKNRILKIVTDDFNIVPSSRNLINKGSSNEIQCVAMFEALKFRPSLQGLVDSMMHMLRGLSHKMGGRFIAVDLKLESRLKKQCHEDDSFIRRCYSAGEIREFLKKIGFSTNTTIYLTQSSWIDSLNPLRDLFPGTFIKDAIIPAAKQALYSGGSERNRYDEYIDYYICTQSNVFVPSFPSSRFCHSIVGERIGVGKTQVLVPSSMDDGSDKAEDYISPDIVKKEHYAYSCFC